MRGQVDVVIGTTGGCPARCASRTWGSSWSTRSSASASSTRRSSADAHQRRRPRDVGDADPAHAGDGGDRHPRDVDAGDPAEERHPSYVRGPLRGEADRGRDPLRLAGARARSSTSTTRSSRSKRPPARLRELLPKARIATAHGKLGEHRLEQVMLDFWEKRFDVLVCTTIVETGLDISNANTLILERADLLGLSQLHQLRGRVGRRPGTRLRLLPVPAGARPSPRPRTIGCRPSPSTRTWVPACRSP